MTNLNTTSKNGANSVTNNTKAILGGQAVGMRFRTQIKAGALSANLNEAQATGMRVRTRVKAGSPAVNHNEAQATGMRVRTNLKAGRTLTPATPTGMVIK